MAGTAPIWRSGESPYAAPNKPPLPPSDYVIRQELGLTIEQNVTIPLRDGIKILADIYLPAPSAKDLPVLLSWSPYGKHARSNKVFWPHSGVDPSWLSSLTPFEGPDPVFWCGHKYAVAVVDPRGAWLSEGDFHHNGIQEAEDLFDTIECLADQPWSNGKVGMTGVSYLAGAQYLAASQNPPALTAINPWEAFSDWYREFAYHGGIPETGFLPRASDTISYSLNRTEDTWANAEAHPLMDDFWRSKGIALEAIEVPAYIVAGWADQGLHLRGTLEAYKRISSVEKWLDIHGQKKWANYYRPDSQMRRLAFFDHFLKSRKTTLSAWPKVRLEVREQRGVSRKREESEWPLKRTDYQPLWLNAQAGVLSRQPCSAETSISYSSAEESVHFDICFDVASELTGHAKLKLWVESDGASDMDLFIALQKLDASGNLVGFTYYSFYEDGPVALGWLRVSHRSLDANRTTPWQPVHSHAREDFLSPGQIVPVDIELWPSSTHFEPGESLRVIVAGRDIYQAEKPNLPFAKHEKLHNIGRHIIHSGGRYDSHLLAPFIPAEEEKK